jgi:PKD repeat protein
MQSGERAGGEVNTALGGPPAAGTPTASFSVSVTSGTAPLNVSFTDLSSQTPNQWSWDFGDTSTAAAQDPNHLYTTPGVYTVSLTATNANGSHTRVLPMLISVSSPIDAWKESFNGVNGWDANQPLIAGDAVDYDGDGVPTLWEYVRGTSPAVADTDSGYILAEVLNVGGTDHLEVSYLRAESLPPGVVIGAHFSTDLTSWSAMEVVEGATPSSSLVVTEGAPSGGTRRVHARRTTVVGTLEFARLSVTRLGP